MALLALEAARDATFKTHKHLVPRVALFYYYVLGLVRTLEIYSNRFLLAAVKLAWIGNAR